MASNGDPKECGKWKKIPENFPSPPYTVVFISRQENARGGVSVWCNESAVYHLLYPWQNKNKRSERGKEFPWERKAVRMWILSSHFIFLLLLRFLISDDVSRCLLMLCINCLASFSGTWMRSVAGWDGMVLGNLISSFVHTNLSIYRNFRTLSISPFFTRKVWLSCPVVTALDACSTVVSRTFQMKWMEMCHTEWKGSISHKELWRSIDIKSWFQMKLRPGSAEERISENCCDKYRLR